MNPRRPLLIALALCLPAAPVAGQLIPLRTVPLATGDQFLVHPSETLAMGGVSIAVTDRWADPFSNPATGVRLEESVLVSSPTFYGIEGDRGAGRTFPVAALFAGDTWFGGGSVALQQVVNDEPGVFFRGDVWEGPARRLDDGSATNLFVDLLLGRSLGDGNWAAGASLGFATLQAVDGVDLLYAGADHIDQSGHLLDLRAGVTGELSGGSTVEVVAVHSRVDMTHDVSYTDWRWIDSTGGPTFFRRDEENLDRTNTTGLQGTWRRPVGEAGWTVGTVLTVNRKDHPKIPNYDIQNIPRDPGESWAWNVGMGIGRSDGPFRFGLDVVVEPIWSDTWQEAGSDFVGPTGEPFREGDRTIENDFFFTNVHMRAGAGRETDRWGFQLGVRASAYDYELEQWNRITETRRDQDESWMEWSPSLGLAVKFPEVHVRYAGRMTLGTGRPGVARWTGGRADALSSVDFIVAPSGPLTLQDARVLTHQVTVSLPIR